MKAAITFSFFIILAPFLMAACLGTGAGRSTAPGDIGGAYCQG